MNTSLTPLNGHVLVELGGKYKNIVATAKAYETKTNGVVVALAPDCSPQSTSKNVIGKLVYWQDYREGSSITQEGHEYVFVKYEDLQGFEDA